MNVTGHGVPTPSIKQFSDWRKVRRYNTNTINVYSEVVLIFLKFRSDNQPHEIDNRGIERFNKEYILARNLSSSF